MKIKDVMFKLLEELDKKGFILVYKIALENGSCYIKVDYGLCCIRITTRKDYSKESYPYLMTIIIDDDINYDDIVKKIKDYKDDKLNKNGFYYYEKMLEGKKNPGRFWYQAKIYND